VHQRTAISHTPPPSTGFFCPRIPPLFAGLVAALFLFWYPQAFAQSKTLPSADFEALSLRANEARDADRLEEAIALYKKALALRSSWTEGWWSLGTLFYDEDKYGDAAEAFRKVVQQNAKNGTAHVMLGLCEYELGEEDSALKELGTGRELGVLKDEQLQQVLLYHQGILLLRKERFFAAKEALSTLLRSGAQSDAATLAAGMAVLLIKPVNLPPENTPGRDVILRAGRAESFLAQKKFDEARAEYESLARDYPEFPNIHYAYGRFLLDVNAATEAIAEFQREIQNNPKNTLARLQIAATDYRVDSPAGLAYAKEAVALNPQFPFGHYLLGLLLLDTGDVSHAISELEFAKRFFPQEPSLYFALGSAYARVGRKQEATQARATFKRLQEKASKETEDNVYGSRPSNLEPGKLSGETGNQPRP